MDSTDNENRYPDNEGMDHGWPSGTGLPGLVPVTGSPNDYQILAPRLSKAVLGTVFTGFCAVAFLRILSLKLGVEHTTLCVVYMLALLFLQLGYFSRHPKTLRTKVGAAALLAEVCFTYLPLLEFGDSWVGMPGFVAGTVLLVLPTVQAWTAFTAVVASVAVIQSFAAPDLVGIVYIMVSTTITGLVIYGLTRMSTLVTEVNAARTQLAEMAVSRERLRFSRDLHDLLGYSLSAITLKSELTHRLVAKDPGRAMDELSEILDISRQALADVRSVASGYRDLSLEEESRSARSVLAAADVTVRMDIDYQDLPGRIATVLATVLREGVTNVLRHSKAEQAEITIRQTALSAEIDVINDGIPKEQPEPVAHSGSGIQNLAHRVTALEGTLTAGTDESGRFHLRAVVPLRPNGQPQSLLKTRESEAQPVKRATA